MSLNLNSKEEVRAAYPLIAYRDLSETEAVELQAQIYNYRLTHVRYGDGYPVILQQW